MRFVADLHLHSFFSRATSKDCDLPHFHLWAQRKGLTLLGTSDFTHPGWFQRLQDELVEAEPGLYKLRPDLARAVDAEVPVSCRGTVRFILQVEISNIYKRGGKVRKVHNLVYMPDLEAAQRFNRTLARAGNIASDGRPILGLDSRDLLEMVLLTDSRAFLIPAHIWTPWFSVLGSKSGFDSVAECYADLEDHIFAAETGLSSDPAMNWRLDQLDDYLLVSSSDAHSPSKLAREANLFDCELGFQAVRDALSTGQGFEGTLEFYPHEGKYHFDGHRKCAARMTPEMTRSMNGLCPVCGGKVTVGVLHRVEELADHPAGRKPPNASPFESLICLPEILSQVHGVGPGSKSVQAAYQWMIQQLGPELRVLREIPMEDLARAGGALAAEAVQRARQGLVEIDAGYDGEYGTIRIFSEGERQEILGQKSLFALQAGGQEQAKKTTSDSVTDRECGRSAADYSEDGPLFARSRSRRGLASDGARRKAGRSSADREKPACANDELPSRSPALLGLTAAQTKAVLHPGGPLAIIAGPGTGKTRTLTCRVAHRVLSGECDPGRVLALTFTRKARDQMSQRLARLLSARIARKIRIRTFHELGLEIMEELFSKDSVAADLRILDRNEAEDLLALFCPELPARRRQDVLEQVSRWKAQGLDLRSIAPVERLALKEVAEASRAYLLFLEENELFDLDDLVTLPNRLLLQDPKLLAAVRQRFRWVYVDEYQDLSPEQETFLALVCPEGSDITVIGDPDQAIYAFRGADPRAIERFVSLRPNAEVIALHQSFRTPDLILEAAHRVIGTGADETEEDRPGRVFSQIRSFGPIPLHMLPTEKAEAEFVVASIERMMGGTGFFSMDSGRASSDLSEPLVSFGDVAVLFRLNAQLGPLEEAFHRSGMPYATCTWKRELGPLARTVVAAIRAGLDPRSKLARYSLLLRARKAHMSIRASAQGPLSKEGSLSKEGPLSKEGSLSKKGSLSKNEDPLPAPGKIAEWVRSCPEVPKGFAPFERALQAAREVEKESLSGGRQTVADLAGRLLTMLWPDPLGREAVEAAMLELSSMTEVAGTDLRRFVKDASFCSPQDAVDTKAHRIHLISMHAAKGLEFPVVFLVGVNDGILPFRAPSGHCILDEERRLFYVGMTRASSRLILCAARKRTLFGRSLSGDESPFLTELNERLLCKSDEGLPPRKRKRARKSEQLSLL